MHPHWAETHEPHPPGSKHKVGGKTHTVVTYNDETDRYITKSGRVGDRHYGGLPATAIGYKSKNPNLQEGQFK